MGEQQGSLFQPNAYGEDAPIQLHAHRGDPWTSHESAAKATKSGKVKRHREIALALVKATPGRTGYELWQSATTAQRTELESVHELYRRLSDLHHAKLVRQGDARACEIKGSTMITWFVV